MESLTKSVESTKKEMAQVQKDAHANGREFDKKFLKLEQTVKESVGDIDEQIVSKMKNFRQEVSADADAKMLNLNQEIMNLQNDMQTIDTSLQELRNDHQSDMGKMESDIKDAIKKSGENQEQSLSEMQVF